MKDTLNKFVAAHRQRHNGILHYGFEDAKEAMAAAPEHAPVIGTDMNGNPVHTDLNNDSPHVLLSMGTGGGKSVTLKSLLAQFLRHGTEVVILDYKRQSHRWARRIPENVTYCRDIEEIHDTLEALAEEGMDRFKAADTLSDEEYDRGEWMGNRIVIAVEEMNSLIAELEDYWTEVRTKNAGNRFWQIPRRSPAVKALHKMLAMGRAANINILAVAQRASVSAMGSSHGSRGGDARENFATRVLSRYTHSTWKMLVPDCDYQPPSEYVGRAQVAVGSEAVETQILYLSDDDAVDWATGKVDVEGYEPTPEELQRRVDAQRQRIGA